MPTIIDSLVVELGFDTAGLDAGRKRVEDTFKKTGQAGQKAGKEIENSAKHAGDFMNRLRNNVLSLFAAFTAGRGLRDFVAGMTTTDAALGRFAKTVGMTAQEVATWRAAGSLIGADAKDIDATFQSLTQQFQNFALTGESTVVPYFRSLGIAMSDATGKMRPMDQLLMELAKRIQTMDPAKAVALMNGMGISPGMQTLLLQGPAAIQKLLDSQRALAEAQARDAPAAARRQQAWNDFLNQATAIGVVLLETLTPAIIALTEAAKAFSEWGQRHPAIVGAAFAALTGIVLALSAAITVSLVGGALATAAAGFAALTGAVGGAALGLAILTETALPALSAAFLSLGIAIEATPIGWIITGIAAISVAGWALYKNWDSIAKWWRELWGDMSEDAEGGSDRIVNSADKLKGSKTPEPAPAASARNFGPGQLPSSLQTEKDIQAMMRMGWTREQATGVVANLIAESSGRADAVGDNGQAYGLAQWHPDRQARFKAWTGKDIRDATRDEQLAFINYELRGPEKKAGYMLQQTTTAEHAARAFNTHFERPKDIPGQNAKRAAIASAIGNPTVNVAKPAPAQTPTQAAISAAMNRPSAAVAPPRATVMAANVAGGRSGNYNHQSSEQRIGEIKVYTQATDAAGIARDLKPALQRDTFAQQANFGPA